MSGHYHNANRIGRGGITADMLAQRGLEFVERPVPVVIVYEKCHTCRGVGVVLDDNGGLIFCQECFGARMTVVKEYQLLPHMPADSNNLDYFELKEN
jgi:DnaJ-class molecular chaperone